jgi:AcrR family transcriptional regulator
MQKLDEKKRQDIIAAAVTLFASRPFHEVRLEDVASTAKIGKGTIYLYFKNKEDLYGSLILDGFSQLVERLREQVVGDVGSSWELLSKVVRELVAFATGYPNFYHLMRQDPDKPNNALRDKRLELSGLIEGILRKGIRSGELTDPRPELTAHFVQSCVRSAIVFGPPGLGKDAIANHILRILGNGLLRKDS